MKKFFLACLLLLLVCVQPLYAALTKSDADVDEWAEIAQNAVREGAVYDVSTHYTSALHIDVALSSATAHTGTKVTVFASSKSSGDEDWTELAEYVGPIGTANPESLAGAEAAGQTVIEVASTVNYDGDGTKWIFLEDDTVANSEMCRLESHVGNTSVTITDALTNAHDASDTLYSIADNKVVNIPIQYQRVKVEYDNTFDSNGATVHVRCRISMVTAL